MDLRDPGFRSFAPGPELAAPWATLRRAAEATPRATCKRKDVTRRRGAEEFFGPLFASEEVFFTESRPVGQSA